MFHIYIQAAIRYCSTACPCNTGSGELWRHYHGVLGVFFTGDFSRFRCTMTEAVRDEQTAKQLKRANEENEDSAEKDQAAKRIKADGEHTEDEKKYPKKKVALLMAYCGKGYYGMQVLTVAGFLSQV